MKDKYLKRDKKNKYKKHDEEYDDEYDEEYEDDKNDKELKQLKKLVTKITEIKDVAISYRKWMITLFFEIIGFFVGFGFFIHWISHLPKLSSIKNHLQLDLFYVFSSITIIAVIVLLYSVISGLVYCVNNFKHLNSVIKSLYTRDIFDYEVKKNIKRYKKEIMFCSFIQRMFYIPKISNVKIDFLQEKIHELKIRKQK